MVFPDGPSRDASSGPRRTSSLFGSGRAIAQSPYQRRTSRTPLRSGRTTTAHRVHSDVSMLDLAPATDEDQSFSTIVMHRTPSAETSTRQSEPAQRSHPRQEESLVQSDRSTSLLGSVLSAIWPFRPRGKKQPASHNQFTRGADPTSQMVAPPTPAARPSSSSTPIASTPLGGRRPTFTPGADLSTAEVSAPIGYPNSRNSRASSIRAQKQPEFSSDSEDDDDDDEDNYQSPPEETMEVERTHSATQATDRSRSREQAYTLLSQFFQEKAAAGRGLSPLSEAELAGCRTLLQQCYPDGDMDVSAALTNRVLPSPAAQPPVQRAPKRSANSAVPSAPSALPSRPPPVSRAGGASRPQRTVRIYTLPGQRPRVPPASRSLGTQRAASSATPRQTSGLFTPYRSPGVYGTSVEPQAKRQRLDPASELPKVPQPTPESVLPPPPPPEQRVIPNLSFHPGSAPKLKKPAPKPMPKQSLTASALKDLLSENPLPEDRSSQRAALTNPYAVLAPSVAESQQAKGEEAKKRIESMVNREKKALRERKKRPVPSTSTLNAKGGSDPLLDLIQQTAHQASQDKEKRKRGCTEEEPKQGRSPSPSKRLSAHWSSSIPRHPSPLKNPVPESHDQEPDTSGSLSNFSVGNKSVAPPSAAFTFAPPTSDTSDSSVGTGSQKVVPPSARFSLSAPNLATEVSTSKPTFSFSAPIQTEKAVSATKPSFSFGSPKPAEEDALTAKPSLSFGAPAASDSEASAPSTKPSFSFSAPKPAESAPNEKLSFSFGPPRTTKPAPAPESAFKFDKPGEPAPAPASAIAPVGSSVLAEEARKAVLSKPDTDLPSFSLYTSFASSSTRSVEDQAGAQTALNQNVDSIPNFDFPTVRSFGFSPSTTSSSVPTPAPATSVSASSAAPTPNLGGSDSDAPSAGEEGERTLGEARVKAMMLKAGEWKNVGVGIFRVNQDTTTDKTRALMRSEGNGNILINFALYADFKAKADKLNLAFLGFDPAGQPTQYRLRVKTKDDEQALESALNQGAQSMKDVPSNSTSSAAPTPTPASSASPSSITAPSSSALPSAAPTPHLGSDSDAPSAGEEGERTLGEARVKALMLKDGEWKNVGVGIFRVNQDTCTNKARALMRSEGIGNVLINFALYADLKVKIDKLNLAFLGFDQEGNPTQYRLRVKTKNEEQALQSALAQGAEAMKDGASAPEPAPAPAPPRPLAPAPSQLSSLPPLASSDSSVPAAATSAEPSSSDEDQGAVAAVRTKVFKYDGTKWEILGVGQVKITTVPKPRLILRSEPAGHVLLNFNLHSTMGVRQEDKVLSLIGLEGAKPINLRVKTLNVSDAQELKSAIEDHQPSASA